MPNSFVWPQVFRELKVLCLSVLPSSFRPGIALTLTPLSVLSDTLISLWEADVLTGLCSECSQYLLDMSVICIWDFIHPHDSFSQQQVFQSSLLTVCYISQVCVELLHLFPMSVCARLCVCQLQSETETLKRPWRNSQSELNGEEMSTLTSQHRSGVDTHRSQVTTLILWIQNRVV